ncbi:hypothetical protein [Candidatus Palauibacter soopunensis]|uniref:hypothetical protein n=1 Tax=Candidatus Palauibacter soopunensis TaxID=3056739 RepID=UPI00238BEA6B|nr:hypothetical protein [Candidatus Palauibacter soopunensis]MDE2879482.1 outer membrane beta-barrel protein [Candidatus Palauibacter soopunensis]
MRRPSGVLLFFFFLLWGLAPGASDLTAQMAPAAPLGDDTGPELFGLAGVIQPLNNLTDNTGAYGTVMPPDVMMGGEVTYWASRAVGIGVMGLYSPATLEGVAGGPGRGPGTLGEMEYLAGTVNLTFRLRSSGSAGALEPYFTMGGGLRQLKFYGAEVPKLSATDPMATAAIGVRVQLMSALWFRGELRDMASYYISAATDASKLQNDIGVTIGFGYRFR